MRIAIIDDRKTDREYLSEMIYNCFRESDLSVSLITAFDSGELFLQDYEKGKYDLIFLDIYMPEGNNGIETARKIRETDSNVKLVFATVSNEFASESYAVAASYYLRKPFDHADIKQMITRLHLTEQETLETLTLPNGQILPLRSIVYTSFSGHYVTIHLISGEQLHIRYTQRDWENLLIAFPGFILCTKGIIVNLNEVKRLEATLFVMNNNDYVPISRRKYQAVKQTYSDFLIKKARRRECMHSFTHSLRRESRLYASIFIRKMPLGETVSKSV